MFALLLLFLTSTLASQSAMDFFIVLMVLMCLKACIQGQVGENQSAKSFFKSGAFKIYLFWVLTVAVGYINALNNQGFGSQAMDSQLVLKGLLEFKWILALFTMIYAIEKNRDRLPELFKYFAVALGIASIYAVGIFFYGQDPLNSNPHEHQWGRFYRSGGFLQSPMTMSHLYVLYFSVILGWFFERILSFKKMGNSFWKSLHVTEKYLLAGGGLTGLAVLLSFTRGVWLGLFVGLAVVVLVVKPKWIFAFVASVASVLAVTLAAFEPFRERLLYVFNSAGYDSERFWIWKANWEIVREHFFIGVGYMHNKNLLPDILAKLGAPENTLISHAHNQYLHFLAGTGIVGLLCYLAFWLYFLRLNLLALRSTTDLGLGANMKRSVLDAYGFDWQRGILIGCLIAQVTFLVGGLTESNFEHTKVRYGVFFIWALVWSLSAIREVAKRPRA